MIDFTLNEVGDIVLASAYQYPSFTIDYYTPIGNKKYEAFRINFDTDISQYDTEEGMRIDFSTDLKTDSTQWFSTPAIRDKAEIAQEILIRLKTEYGEFTYLPELGSRIVLERHNDIKSEAVLRKIKEYVESAIADIDFEEEPVVTIERIDDNSRFRYETLRIIIDTGKTQHYTSTI